MIDDDWIQHHFDVHDHELGLNLHPTLARARELCPFARSDQQGGYWVATRYEDVLRIAQDWETFSNELGITVPVIESSGRGDPTMKIIPVGIDPPLQKTFKRLINRYFTAAAVAPWEDETRALVDRLIDGFVERGECDFMAEFARPFPGLAFFDLALHAPSDDLAMVNAWATAASATGTPEAREAIPKLAGWIGKFMARRREEGPRGDVVDAVMDADVDGRPITTAEAIGTVQLLIFGGLDTTAGVLGMIMQRFCAQPEILALLRERPELLPAAVEELLRLDGSFICIGRTARHAAEVRGTEVAAGDKVIMYWASANRDPDEFDRPDEFDPERERNRHIAFGAGPHRCAGSNLARMNIRIALEQVLDRLHDLRLQPDAEIDYHSTFSRAPLSVPITFTPAPRRTRG